MWKGQIRLTAQWHAALQSGVAPAIPPSTTIWVVKAEWHCPFFHSLTQQEEEANRRYLWSIFIQNGHRRWVNETKAILNAHVQFQLDLSSHQGENWIQTDGQTHFSSFYSGIVRWPSSLKPTLSFENDQMSLFCSFRNIFSFQTFLLLKNVQIFQKQFKNCPNLKWICSYQTCPLGM